MWIYVNSFRFPVRDNVLQKYLHISFDHLTFVFTLANFLQKAKEKVKMLNKPACAAINPNAVLQSLGPTFDPSASLMNFCPSCAWRPDGETFNCRNKNETLHACFLWNWFPSVYKETFVAIMVHKYQMNDVWGQNILLMSIFNRSVWMFARWTVIYCF